MRTGVTGALAASLVFCAAGCERRPVPLPDPGTAAPAATTVQITVHVKDMTKVLEITWRDWPNRVEEALSGLPGVTVLDDRDYTKDFIHLRYDTGKVTPGRIVEVIREQGFQGTIVPDPKASAPDKPPSGGDAR